ncbi:MAG: hypothetical protein ACREFQ_07850 [Stellaceae bacterium]
MRRDLDFWEKRLARPFAARAAQRAARERAAARHRIGLRAWVAVAAIIRRAFPEVDLAVCRALRLGAAAELAAIPDTPALAAADEALIGAEPEANEAAAHLARLTARCEGAALDPGRAAPAELLVRAALSGDRGRTVL